MKIAMIGSGYVGLVSGACFADFGHEVVCVDKDEGKIARLNANIMPIYEPGLDALVKTNVDAGRLSFSTDVMQSVKGCGAIFIAVGTPSRRGDGHADLSYVYAAAEELARAIDPGTVVVTKSTVPVGTGDEVERIIRETSPDLEFAVVSNPEFLREGAAIGDFKRPDRIVVGSDVEWARDVMRAIYRPLFLNESPLLFTSRRSSELIKYAANAFLATKITFINEMADLCEKLGANVQDVSRGIGLDNRIGPKFLHAGPGYGGSCFPKDTLALLKTAQDNETPVRVVEAVVQANDLRKRAMGRKIINALGGDVRGMKIGLLGLTFKPNTDDMRDAPSIAIVQTLLDAGAIVHAHDPEGMEEAAKILPDVVMTASAYDAAQDAHAVALVTEWDAYRALDLKKLHAAMAGDVLVDLRNIYRPGEAQAAGFNYVSVGR
ncbi:MAG: UDP-glucose 6-dehydrogenase [Sphingomonadales bacterium 35-56-22]|jgi:UDPglucose 6-dehydrogenase|uniref:UDP-glucose dehydrogenase family protein n=1 Tax=Sphingorhabdus sp. TaxID=1902408 RepID=UPI000BD4C055|nr:UDP-glucose/GDP-mannose dehydrogenase family protein [Sphingorhabdus sp.]OYY16140.1 MAG: UDP-glucose 6-dehydrogenase [Sphingomonadales bacterium 35-56-22]OYY97672.1 MAG: UDP-glucose 6-dehydrogenase [Sphingomonadales bacterium 28-56-43]OYZ61884.1 MAG: UDP-glucose 6-dehydrogenase [Sphingomonadales bacterium 24-56-14]OZA84103.1 MAG: UDP-glucose 6-dehydrogenase [Sphingomonadales bacterium 39-57-19]HQS11773.1 UDP-glucose/GDP-mannose dehydrogenase family protein [Sphingorhabdus sp.]